MLLSNYIKKI